MKRIKLVGAGLLLILIAMFLLGCDSPVTGIIYVAGVVLLITGSFSWACKLRWAVALAIGGIMLVTTYFAGIYIPQIVIDRFVGDERNEFLVHLIYSILLGPGILLVSMTPIIAEKNRRKRKAEKSGKTAQHSSSNVWKKQAGGKTMKTIATAICICSFVCSGLAAESQSREEDKVYAQLKTKCDLGRLRESGACFAEYEKIQFTKVHKPYRGKMVSIYESFDSYEPLTFQVKKSGIVAVLICKKFPGYSVKKLESDGWVVVDKISMYNQATRKTNELSILEKEFTEGEYTFEKEKGFGIRLIKM